MQIKLKGYEYTNHNKNKNKNFQQKHISVVLVLLFCKFQPLIAQIEFSINGETWHQYPITKGIFSNSEYTQLCRNVLEISINFRIAIIQLLVLIQMFLLSIWSHNSYKTTSRKSLKIDDV